MNGPRVLVCGGRTIHGAADFAVRNGWKLRMSLSRWWDDRPRALVGMTNPSTAAADANDATIHSLIRLCRPLDVGGFDVVNFEPYIATDPNDLYRWREAAAWNEPDAYKELCAENLALIRKLSAKAAIRIIAWGNLVPSCPHATKVLMAMWLDGAHDLYAFGVTQDGSPKHPMARGKHRIPDGTIPVIWRAAPPASAS